MTVEHVQDQSLKWLSPLEQPFRVDGFLWLEQEGKFRRLPSAPKYPLPPHVDNLANCTAGGQISFRTNSSRLSVKIKLTGIGFLYHMTATGQCGVDCYLGEPDDQQFWCTARFDHTKDEYEASFYDWGTKKEHTVTLYLPLYQGVEELWIGVDPDAELHASSLPVSDRPVVLYGTSILQGGCASRPGMAYSNIMSRSIPMTFVNLGFSGNGKGEPEVARVIAEIPNPGLFVLDYEANVPEPLKMEETLPVFIQILRERHPSTPILVISKIRYSKERFDDVGMQVAHATKKVQQDIVSRLHQEGDTQLHFLDGMSLLGDDYSDCTVDGVHPTDLGFQRMAKSLDPVFRALLKNYL